MVLQRQDTRPYQLYWFPLWPKFHALLPKRAGDRLMHREIDTDVTQLFVGTRLPTTATCIRCEQTFTPGDPCILSATRPEDAPTYAIEALYCPECAPETIPDPTLGTTDYLLEAQLAHTETASPRQHHLTLLTIDIRASSPLTEGAPTERSPPTPTGCDLDTPQGDSHLSTEHRTNAN